MKLIIRKDKVFPHVGIFVNRELVLHYSSKTCNFFGNDRIVKMDTLERFAMERKYKLINITENKTKDVLSQAEKFIQLQRPYHLISFNCITFVLWCLYGISSTTLKTLIACSQKFGFKIFSLIDSWE